MDGLAPEAPATLVKSDVGDVVASPERPPGTRIVIQIVIDMG